MATRKKATKEEPPPEEPVAETQDEHAEDENAEKEDERPKRTLLHLPRGPGRPVVGQVLSMLSEPHLKQDLRQTFSSYGSEGLEVSHRSNHAEFRQSLQQELQYLDMQTKKRKAEAKRRRETEKYAESARQGHQKFLENSRLGKQRPPWTYTDAPGFMEPPIYEQGEALTCNRNENMCGIYNVQHPDYKPPHAEFDVYGGWTPFQTNKRNEMLYEFKDKEWQGTRMSPAEKMFKERLDRSIDRATQLTKQDALDRTSGSHKKDKMMRTADDFSCLKRKAPAWVAQNVSTHTYFEQPNLDPFKGDVYDPSLAMYIEQTDRAMSFKKNIVAPNNSKSFWRPPSQGVSGTCRRLQTAQELRYRNLRGCHGLKPTPSPTKPAMLLKGTGSLSFSHFKDALLEPTFERFSPSDRSGPP
mmetsp:Transcript_123469/g.195794  ORF Transcript_123469/g.195794 Transcript_123469/m.195794 type:complete len:413 (+) Transcript_123469:82-1320(+)